MANTPLKYTGYYSSAEKYDENEQESLVTPLFDEENSQPDTTPEPETSPLEYTGYYSSDKQDNNGPELIPSIDETRDNMRSGEGFWGGVGDVAAGITGGLVRGAEMVYDAMEWFAPEGTDIEHTANRMSAYIKDFRTKHEEYFGESKRGEEARTAGAMNPRGWLYGGFESLGTMAPMAMAGGPAGVVLQFWGGTAQEAYDEAVDNERKGIGRKLSENEKIMYANLKGAWEGGLEAVQDFLPFAIVGKALLPKTAVGNVIRSAIKKPGNAMFNVAKEYLKMVIPEVSMEVAQEYLGAKTSYEYGQSEKDPGWEDVKGVIGPTIIMTAVLGAAAMRGEGKYRKRLHDALTKKNVHPDDRVAAVGAVYEIVKKEDPELAEMWKVWAAPAAKANQPVAIPLDEEVRANKPPQVAVEKLDEALEVERQKNKEYQAQVQARLEGKADKETEKKPAAKQKETPNENGVIEATLQEAPQSVDTLNTQINQLERTIENNPTHPEIEKFKQALVEKIQQRDEIISQSKLLPVGSPNRPDASGIGNIQPLEGDNLDVEKTSEKITETGQEAEAGTKEEKPERPVIITQEYVDEKYAPLLEEDQDFEENLSDDFDPDNISPQTIQNELEKSDNLELTKRSLRVHLADKVGDLIEESRYESVREGLAAEQQLDEMIDQVDKFQGSTEVGQYTEAGLKQGIHPVEGEKADVFAGVEKPVQESSTETDTATRIDQIKAEGNSLRTKRDAKSIARKKVLGEELARLRGEEKQAESAGETAVINADSRLGERQIFKPNQELAEYDYEKQKWVTGEEARQAQIKHRKETIEILKSSQAEAYITNQPSPQREYTVEQALQNETAELIDLESMGVLTGNNVPSDWKSPVKQENATKQLAETPEIKYSKKELGQPLVDHENIPDDMEVTTTVISDQTGQEVEAKINAKRAVKSLNNLLTKLETLLDCVS